MQCKIYDNFRVKLYIEEICDDNVNILKIHITVNIFKVKWEKNPYKNHINISI